MNLTIPNESFGKRTLVITEAENNETLLSFQGTLCAPRNTLRFRGTLKLAYVSFSSYNFILELWDWTIVTGIWNKFKALFGLFVTKSPWKAWEVTVK